MPHPLKMAAMRQLGRPSGSIDDSLLEGKRKNADNEERSHAGSLPQGPAGRSGPPDRTAGGFGGAAPASLDLYGQSRMTLHFRS